MEPENNIELILQGYLKSKDTRPLLLIGSTANAFGTSMKNTYGNEKGVRFAGAIYNAAVINALRYYSLLYFHGHSVGGTNPSLLEAMGCSSVIAAHGNPFNQSILGEDAFYFTSVDEVSRIIQTCSRKSDYESWIANNREKIVKEYNWVNVVDAYEQAMLNAYVVRKKSAR
jgi:glycosyltransferase involved in cell wall biosynthesis